jgi:bacillithiol system protein YtxJ
VSHRYQLLTSVVDLDSVVEASFTRPVLFFKHSLTCGTSAWAHEELDALLDGPAVPVDVFVVHVQTSRAISDAIADRFNIRHQSPQALLVRNGTVAWHASHHRLSQAEMARAIERVIHLEPHA